MRAHYLVILLSITAHPVAAQDRPRIPAVLTLRQAVEMALQHSPVLRSAQARADQAAARARAARDLSLPRASLSGNQAEQTVNLHSYGLDSRLLDLNTSSFPTFDGRLAVDYDIWDPVRHARRQSLRFEADAGLLDQAQAREALIAAVANTFLEIGYGQEVRRALERQAEIAAGTAKIARDRYEKGVGSAIDPNRAEQEVHRIQLLQLDAASDLQRAKTNLARLLDAQIGTAFDVDETNSPAQDLPSAAEALRVALTTRSEYRAALARVDAAKAAAAAVQAKRLPSAQLHADSGFDGSSPTRGIVTYRIFGSLQIPLFRPEQWPEEAEAEARLREARAAADELRSTVEAEVRVALDDAAASSRKVAVAGEVRDLAQVEVELTSRRVAAGVTDNTEELAAQERLLRAEEEIARVRLETRRRRVELYFKIGKPDEIYR